MAASQSGVWNVQEFTDLGALAVGGRIYTYEFGTTTHKTAYTDAAGVVPHTYTADGSGGQYIALDARGELPAPLFLTSGGYDLTYKTAAGATVWTRAAYPVDQGALDLIADLAALTDGKGAGLIGYSTSAVYGATTVGSKLQGFKDIKTDFGAVGDGVTDDLVAWTSACESGERIFLPPGTYYLSDHYRPTPGISIFLAGQHRDLVTVKSAAGRIPIFCDATVGTNARIGSAHVEGITFDGGHVRTASSFPYNSDAGASMTQALNLRGSKGGEDRGNVVITRCRFKDINGLPVWIADFDGSVEFSYNHVYRTKDAGFLYNDDLKVINNTIEFCADNGMSVSRSNKRIFIAGNHINDCSGAGIFVGGVDLTSSGTVTATGTYTVGGALTVGISSGTFNTEDIGVNLTLRSGADRAIVRITDVPTSASATAVAMTSVPASLQATATSDWSKGPISGAQTGSVVGNVVDGAYSYGVYMSQGCKDIVVSENTLRRSGTVRDSETGTLGTIVSGSTSLALDDAIGVTNGEWVIVEPDYTNEDTFIAQVSSGGGTTTLTLASAATETLVNASVRRATRNTGGGFGVVCIGSYENSTINEYAEHIDIHDNIIIDSVVGGVRMGSASGAVRDCAVRNNIIRLRQSAHVVTTNYGVLVDDQGTTNMRTARVDVEGNMISLNNAGSATGIAYRPVDNSSFSFIRIDRNRIRECVTNVSVVEQTGATNITATYVPSSHIGTAMSLDLIRAAALGLDYWVTVSVNAGVMTFTTTLGDYGSTATITDIAWSAIKHPNPVLILRNTSAVNSITFTFNSAKIRTQSGSDVVVPPYGSISFIPITATAVQQIA